MIDNFIILNCAYCECGLKYTEITRDHFFPKCAGGISGKRHKNIVYCCKSCNKLKRDMYASEFLIYLMEYSDHKIQLDKIQTMIINLINMMLYHPTVIGDQQRKLLKKYYSHRNKEKMKTEKYIKFQMILNKNNLFNYN